MIAVSESEKKTDDELFADAERKAVEVAVVEVAAKAAVAKLFDAKDLAQSTRTVQTLLHEKLGLIKYMFLTRSEVKALNVIGLPMDERAECLVYEMLHKADPLLAKEDFDAVPVDAKNALISAMNGVMSRFLPSPPSSGLTQTLKLNASASSPMNTATP